MNWKEMPPRTNCGICRRNRNTDRLKPNAWFLHKYTPAMMLSKNNMFNATAAGLRLREEFRRGKRVPKISKARERFPNALCFRLHTSTPRIYYAIMAFPLINSPGLLVY